MFGPGSTFKTDLTSLADTMAVELPSAVVPAIRRTVVAVTAHSANLPSRRLRPSRDRPILRPLVGRISPTSAFSQKNVSFANSNQQFRSATQQIRSASNALGVSTSYCNIAFRFFRFTTFIFPLCHLTYHQLANVGVKRLTNNQVYILFCLSGNLQVTTTPGMFISRLRLSDTLTTSKLTSPVMANTVIPNG